MATKLQWSLPADGLCNGALAIIVVALVVASREDSHEGLIVHHVEPSGARISMWGKLQLLTRTPHCYSCGRPAQWR